MESGVAFDHEPEWDQRCTRWLRADLAIGKTFDRIRGRRCPRDLLRVTRDDYSESITRAKDQGIWDRAAGIPDLASTVHERTKRGRCVGHDHSVQITIPLVAQQLRTEPCSPVCPPRHGGLVTQQPSFLSYRRRVREQIESRASKWQQLVTGAKLLDDYVTSMQHGPIRVGQASPDHKVKCERRDG
jgi:hypothetical protein